MSTYQVEHNAGFWRIDTGRETVPVLMGGRPVASLTSGWRPRFVYTGFAPIHLLELAHDNGNTATWYLDETMNRLGGELEELPTEKRTELLRKYLDVSLSPWRSLMATPDSAWPAAVDGFSEVNARTLYGLDKLARSEGAKNITWHDASTLTSVALVGDSADGTPPQVSPEHLKSLLSVDAQETFLAALKTRTLSWPSPITGRPVTRVHSLYIDNVIVLYRCVDDDAGVVFCVVCAGHDLRTVGVLFPTTLQAFYLTGIQRNFAENVCTNLMSRIMLYLTRSGRLLPGYFVRRLDGFATPLWGGPAFHVGHHLWNELSALMTTVTSVPPSSYPWVIVQGNPGDGEAYGQVEAIFPELSQQVVRGLQEDADMVEFCCDRGIQILRITGSYVSKTLRDRINVLVKDCKGLDDERAVARGLKEEKVPIVVLGLRVENRTVAYPEAFCTRVVEHLQRRLGRVAVVIDGHNSRPLDRGEGNYPSYTESRAALPPIEVERRIVRSLQATFYGDDVTIIDNIGGTMNASLFWLDQSDFFVAPWGAGLAKYRWAANKPGVVVSSKWVLENKGDVHIYDDKKYMEEPTEIRFISSEQVVDLPDEPVLVQILDPGNPIYSNFKVNFSALFAEIDQLIKFVGTPEPSNEGMTACRQAALLTEEFADKTNNSLNSRMKCMAPPGGLQNLRVALPGFGADFGDRPLPSGYTATCAVEYPVGTFTPFTFSGGNSVGVRPSLGLSFSDILQISIPGSATFYIKTYAKWPRGNFWLAPQCASTLTDEWTARGTDLADQTMSAAPLGTTGTAGFGPSILSVGLSPAKALGIIGDSIGFAPDSPNPIDASKFIDQAMRGEIPTINLSRGGDTFQHHATESRGRKSLLIGRVTSLIVVLGVNDALNSEMNLE